MTTRPPADLRRRRAWIAAGLAIAAFASYGAARSGAGPAEDDGVVVTGEFRADGSCSVALDGQPISGDTAISGHRVYHPQAGVPDGYGIHELSCQPVARTPGDARRSDLSTFSVRIPHREGSELAPGRYRVHPKALERGDAIAAEASVGSLLSGTGDRALSGREGNVRIVRADSSGVVGSFRIVAHPCRSRTGS